MIKDPNSKWLLGDRSSSWLKMKPDYVKVSDIDAVRTSLINVSINS